MTMEMARLELTNEFPDLIMEISEYLSFAETEGMTATELIEDFIKRREGL